MANCGSIGATVFTVRGGNCAPSAASQSHQQRRRIKNKSTWRRLDRFSFENLPLDDVEMEEGGRGGKGEGGRCFISLGAFAIFYERSERDCLMEREGIGLAPTRSSETKLSVGCVTCGWCTRRTCHVNSIDSSQR